MYKEGFKQAYIENELLKQKKKKKNKRIARNLFKLRSQVFPNSTSLASILRGGPSMVGEEKKGKKEKHQDGSGGGKKKKERQNEAPVYEERKKQGHLVPASVLTPNTLVPC